MGTSRGTGASEEVSSVVGCVLSLECCPIELTDAPGTHRWSRGNGMPTRAQGLSVWDVRVTVRCRLCVGHAPVAVNGRSTAVGIPKLDPVFCVKVCPCHFVICQHMGLCVWSGFAFGLTCVQSVH